MSGKKIYTGTVVSDKMNKTLVVQVIRKFRHPKYQKLVEQKRKFYVRDDNGKAKMGNQVKFIQSRPISKLVRWRVIEIL